MGWWRNALGLLLVLAVCGSAWAAEPAAPAAPVRIVLVGDSTVATYHKRPADRPSLTGWGQVFGDCFAGPVTVVNCAVSGSSSKSFRAAGRWEKALAEKGDYVFIQFGHNDCPGKGDRSTDPNGDFQDYLRKYVADARKAGARPILVTPVARRTFDRDGKITTTLAPYADAMKRVANEQGVPVIDLHGRSQALFNRLGDRGSADFSASASDRTHFSERGARQIAQLVADSLAEAEPTLARYRKPRSGEPGQKQILDRAAGGDEDQAR